MISEEEELARLAGLSESYFLTDAARYWIGHEPVDELTPEQERRYLAVLHALVTAMSTGKLRGILQRDGGDLDGEERPFPQATLVKRNDLAEWALLNSFRPKFLEETIDRIATEGSATLPAHIRELPYRTELINVLLKAMTKYWVNPKSELTKHERVVADMEEHFKLSNRAAQAIDLIIRPDEKKSGGR